jgi:hypothetical protein
VIEVISLRRQLRSDVKQRIDLRRLIVSDCAGLVNWFVELTIVEGRNASLTIVSTGILHQLATAGTGVNISVRYHTAKDLDLPFEFETEQHLKRTPSVFAPATMKISLGARQRPPT